MKVCRIRTVFLGVLSLVLGAACGGGGGGRDDNNGQGGSPTLSINSIAIVEGQSGSSQATFTASLLPAAAADVTFDYASSDGSADGTDYLPTSGQVSIPAGSTQAQISVTVNGDLTIEEDENFRMTLSNVAGAALGTSVGTATIENDDFPQLSIADGNLVEGDSGTTVMSFDVSLDQPGVADITVEYATSDVTATAADDYAAATGTLTIPAGVTIASIDIDVVGDTDIEADEQFLVNLANASSNARIADEEAVGQIENDDFPTVSVGNAQGQEANAGTTTLVAPITLSAAATADVTVTYATEDDSAVAGEDYTATTGSVVITAGDLAGSIPVQILGDTDVENNEALIVRITDVAGPATLDQDVGTLTILDDDASAGGPEIVLLPTSLSEGDVGPRLTSIIINLSLGFTEDVSVDYSMTDGTATDGEDYRASSGTLTIPAGDTSVNLSVTIIGDTVEEPNENFQVNLSTTTPGVTVATPSVTITIADDDAVSNDPASLRIENTSLTEPDAGTADMLFSVTLDKAAPTDVSVDFATEDRTALAGSDYQATTGTVVIPAGDTATTIAVPIIGDTFSEDDEQLRVRLSNLVGDAEFGRVLATGTILTNEPLARLTIADSSVLEGDSGQSDLEFTVTLDVASTEVTTFNFATSDGTATAGDDYTQATGSTQIPAGDTSAIITVAVTGDTDNEPDETLDLILSSISQNVVVLRGTAAGSIVNDDGTPGWQSVSDLGAGLVSTVSMDASGRGVAIVTTGISGSFEEEINAIRFESGWLTREPLGEYSLVPGRTPKVSMLDNGRIMVAWVDPFTVQTSLYTPGTGWSVAAGVGSDGGFWLDLGGNASGEALVAWQGNGNNQDPSDIRRNTFDGTAWAADEFVEFNEEANAREPLVAIDAAGNRFIYWYQNFDDFRVSGNYFDYYDAATATWTGPTFISELQLTSNESIGALEDGRFAVATQRGGVANDPDSVEFWIYDPATGTWADGGPIETSATEDASLPEFAVDGLGNIVVVWTQQPSSGFYDFYVNRYDAIAGAWSGAERLENSSGTVWPVDGYDVAMGANGDAIVVWSQNIGAPGTFDYRIRASRFTTSDGTWSPPEQIDGGTATGNAFQPAIGMSSTGAAIVTWYLQTGGEIEGTHYIPQ